jgi:mono/diheme cytochrome c family protein
MPTVEEAARAIASGRPGMPPYRGRLSEAETQALARFVSESTRR